MALLPRSDDDVAVSKPVVIGIAVAATVIVLAAVGGVVFWLIRRRKNKKTRNGDEMKHGSPRVIVEDDDFSHLNERSSKVPLIRHEDENQMTEIRHSMSRYDENDESAPLAMPQRARSDATERSLPPSYASATHRNHRPGSSIGGSGGGGLKTLSLVEAHRDDDEHPPQTSPDRNHHRNRLSIRLPAHGRSRSHSRFREEDLDA